MIPKKIHYCWFGKNEKSDLIKYCINSWKKYLSDYEIIEWNEDNFDVNCNTYVKQAYESKKYAFVSDYVRLYALYTQGGIYFDTDVEVLKSLDEFLVLDGFTGFESYQWTVTATMGSVMHNEVIKLLLDYYIDKKFILDNGYDTTPNTQTITRLFTSNYNVNPNGTEQTLTNTNFKVFPTDYFCPKEYSTKVLNITENTYTIHHFNSSWF